MITQKQFFGLFKHIFWFWFIFAPILLMLVTSWKYAAQGYNLYDFQWIKEIMYRCLLFSVVQLIVDFYKFYKAGGVDWSGKWEKKQLIEAKQLLDSGMSLANVSKIVRLNKEDLGKKFGIEISVFEEDPGFAFVGPPKPNNSQRLKQEWAERKTKEKHNLFGTKFKDTMD